MGLAKIFGFLQTDSSAQATMAKSEVTVLPVG